MHASSGSRWAGCKANAESVNSKTNGGREASILSPTKLEELLPNVVNRLSPSNLKRTANNLMDEWEKSLVAPPAAGEVANKENAA